MFGHKRPSDLFSANLWPSQDECPTFFPSFSLSSRWGKKEETRVLASGGQRTHVIIISLLFRVLVSLIRFTGHRRLCRQLQEMELWRMQLKTWNIVSCENCLSLRPIMLPKSGENHNWSCPFGYLWRTGKKFLVRVFLSVYVRCQKDISAFP